MTREEAFNKLKKYQIDKRNPKLVALKVECYDLINEIYKNLKEKICKNCKYFDCEEEDYGFCINNWWKRGNEVDGNLLRVEADFGCNRFERRQK